MARRLRSPKNRLPGLPPWGKTECVLGCGTPTRIAFLAPDDEPVVVGMKPAPLNDRRVSVACTVMDERLVGRLVKAGKFTLVPGETVWIEHDRVCPEIDHPEQLSLPTQED